MNIKKFIDEWKEYDIGQYIDSLSAEHGENLEFKDDCLAVPIPLLRDKIKIHISQLELLDSEEKPTGIPNFEYIDDLGIKFKRYYELRVKITNKEYGDEWYDFYDHKFVPLTFKVGETLFEISETSSLLVLLTEAYYTKDLRYRPEFSGYFTLKMIVPGDRNYQDEFNKGVYYINTRYFKSLTFHVKLAGFSLEYEDSMGLFEYNPEEEDIINSEIAPFRESDKKENKDFIAIEPLILFNYASIVQDEQCFLNYYRVLEFFMYKAFTMKIATLRKDESVDNERLIKEVSQANERKLLKNLILLIIEDKKKITPNERKKNLFIGKDLNALSVELYEYRNSLVHAKEKEINRTNLPNPFEFDAELDYWTNIVKAIALECINSLNKVE